jgi:hypothetical protein
LAVRVQASAANAAPATIRAKHVPLLAVTGHNSSDLLQTASDIEDMSRSAECQTSNLDQSQ